MTVCWQVQHGQGVRFEIERVEDGVPEFSTERRLISGTKGTTYGKLDMDEDETTEGEEWRGKAVEKVIGPAMVDDQQKLTKEYAGREEQG